VSAARKLGGQRRYDVGPVAAFIAEAPEGATTAVCGITGYGKTYGLQAGLASSRRVFVFDPYSAIDRRRGGGTRCAWEGEHFTHDALLEQPGLLRRERFRMVYDPDSLDEARLGARASAMLEILWALGDVDVVLEEAGLFSRFAVPLINRIATGGAHAGLRFFLVAQSFSRLAIDARRNVARLVLFAQGEQADYDLLRGKLGKLAARNLAGLQVGDAPVLWKYGDVPKEQRT